ncbi:MAG: DEAD/DEAH box helicase [Ilumatobacteraceae bacterium]|nr:DEAD/DEAH box helicase [Ilumatobacteraceae bacterium]
MHNWESETARFTPGLRVTVHHGAGRDREGDALFGPEGAEIVVTTYGVLARDASLGAVPWSTVVLDEAQTVKNPNTKAHRAARALAAGQKLALTGTPVENRLADLWSLLDLTVPGLLGGQQAFRARFGTAIERHGDEAAAAELRRLTQPFVLRRTKADRRLLPDLPDKIEQIAYATLTREQAVLYQKVVDQLLDDADRATGMQRRGLVLASLTRLKQICNHPAHALGDGSRLAGRSGKLVRFDELVADLLDVGEQAIVFTQFAEMGLLLQRHLAEHQHLDVPFLHGGVARRARDAMVAAFQSGSGAPLLVVSLRAGGTGLNLTAASQVIHYDRWWNPAVEDQATDRAWRLGQQRTVNVHKLVCEGTVEERIGAVIDEKRRLAQVAVGTGEAWLSELSTDELRELVVLERHSW